MNRDLINFLNSHTDHSLSIDEEIRAPGEQKYTTRKKDEAYHFSHYEEYKDGSIALHFEKDNKPNSHLIQSFSKPPKIEFMDDNSLKLYAKRSDGLETIFTIWCIKN